jgi:hypothetical protein
VTALRRHRDERWPIPKPRNRQYCGPVDWEETTSKYGDLFRRGSDLTGLDWNMVDTALNLVPPGGQARTQGAVSNLVPPGAGVAAQDQPPDLVRPWQLVGTQGRLPRPVARRSAAELTHELRSRLLMQSDRSYHRVISGLQVRVADNTTVIHCASLADRMTVLESLMGALRWLINDLNLPVTIRVTDSPPPADPELPGASGQPANGKPLSA